MRADVFVAKQYPAFARSALLKLFEQNSVKVDGKSTKPGYKLRLKDKIAVEDSLLSQKDELIELPIIYENDSVVVINKPSGVLSHSNGGLRHEPSVASFIRTRLDNDLMSGNDRAGIVHRLDRATSGVMICAKNSTALTYLQRQFAKRSTQKTYLAVVEGELKQPTAIIEAPIMRNPKKPTTFKVHGSGKSAITKYQVIDQTDKYSYLRLEPLTGRTHQLRVHLQYLHHPIVGDWLYGGKQANRLMLHAESLRLKLPSGEDQIFTAELPIGYKKYLQTAGLDG